MLSAVNIKQSKVNIMSQIRSFLRDSLAYILANRKIGYSITYLSDENAPCVAVEILSWLERS